MQENMMSEHKLAFTYISWLAIKSTGCMIALSILLHRRPVPDWSTACERYSQQRSAWLVSKRDFIVPFISAHARSVILGLHWLHGIHQKVPHTVVHNHTIYDAWL